ncbi:carbohydrate-binding family 9-like protein [Daejeonella sp.]|uniref:carbohydrate-binding family 9-like protein n=1 Tax=Daejeonella sp. TaxID=2805397 RepID=UPI003983900B
MISIFLSSRTYATILLLVLLNGFVSAQSVFSGKEALFTTPRQYNALFTATPPVIDGKIDEAAWQNAAWTEYFKDIEGDSKPAPTWNTRAKMTWTAEGLYIAAELLEPHVWAYLNKHDEIVFYDNDFEVFIDPDNDTHRYYEIEINAENTIFDLFMPKPYRNGSGAMFAYNTPGMKTAINIQGTLNNPNDADIGWTVEMFIPFMAVTMGNEAKVPTDGEFWRIDFSRVEWDVEVKEGKYVKLKGANGRNLPEHNWVWSPQGVINMHYPERWGYLFFSKPEVGKASADYIIPYSEKQKKHLWLVYYLQKEYFQKNKSYAKDLKDLGISDLILEVDSRDNKLWMEATSGQFMVYISADENTYSVNDEGLVQVSRISK